MGNSGTDYLCIRVKGHDDRTRETRRGARRDEEEVEEEGGTGLSSRAAKTLVYSNDRGLLFGRIPSLIRFTSSAPSLSSPSVLFLWPVASLHPPPPPPPLRARCSFAVPGYSPARRRSPLSPRLFQLIPRRVIAPRMLRRSSCIRITQRYDNATPIGRLECAYYRAIDKMPDSLSVPASLPEGRGPARLLFSVSRFSCRDRRSFVRR